MNATNLPLRMLLPILCGLAGMGLVGASKQVGAQTVASGTDFGCAVVDGGVRCWGTNLDGRLGNPIFGDVSTATDVATLEPGTNAGVTAVATGFNFACAIANGALKCWGDNSFGQLGDGTTTSRSSPIIAISAGVTSVSLGAAHACAVVNGGAKCWGYNSLGELGTGDVSDRKVPTPVFGLSASVTQVASGGNYSCAVANGGLKCWGGNDYGQLGTNDNVPHPAGPVDVYQLAAGSGVTFAAASSGGFSTCAVINGTAKCWGYNAYGQVGNGTQSAFLTRTYLKIV